ncbi:MAG: hypothetical protein N4A35_04770 [Flavobacteriales bacterium]|jgi:hypothetical protein|nr:hypothetical protein [Flavobacteriales bacterium]
MKYLLLFSLLYTQVSFAQTNTTFQKVSSSFPVQGRYHSNIYSSPNETYRTKERINSNNVNVIEESKEWLVVKYHIDETTLAYGYIKRKDAYIKQYSLNDGKILTVSPQTWDGSDNTFILSVVDYKTGQIIDSTTITNMNHGYRFLELPYQSGLKGVKKMIRFQTYRESCPGLTQNDYIIVTEDGTIQLLLSDISTGEIGWEYETTYLPVKFGNGTIKVLHFDYEGKIINYDTGELTEFKNSQSFKIPLDQLIIKQIEIADPVIENDDYVVDENDEYVMNIIHKTEVYRWNGKQLIKIK